MTTLTPEDIELVTAVAELIVVEPEFLTSESLDRIVRMGVEMAGMSEAIGDELIRQLRTRTFH